MLREAKKDGLSDKRRISGLAKAGTDIWTMSSALYNRS